MESPWVCGDSGPLRLDLLAPWRATAIEGLADRLVLDFPCLLGFGGAGGGHCPGQFRGCNLDLNNATISLKFLKNNTALCT